MDGFYRGKRCSVGRAAGDGSGFLHITAVLFKRPCSWPVRTSQGSNRMGGLILRRLVARWNPSLSACGSSRESFMDGRGPVDFPIELPAFEPEADNEFIGEAHGVGGPI